MMAATVIFPILVGLGFSVYAEVFGTLSPGTDAYMPFLSGLGLGAFLSLDLAFHSLLELKDAHQQHKMLAVLED